MVIFIDVTILLTCLNFDIDIDFTTVFINYRYIFGILHITNAHTHIHTYIHAYVGMYIHTYMDRQTDMHNNYRQTNRQIARQRDKERHTQTHSYTSSYIATYMYVHIHICTHVLDSFPRVGDLRLMDGETQSSGRLEIYDSARGWGTICIEGFTIHSANTACIQLGYSATTNFDKAISLR